VELELGLENKGKFELLEEVSKISDMVVEFALRRKDLRDEFLTYLTAIV